MNEGTKNTILGVTLTFLFATIGTSLGVAFTTSNHLVKIDGVLESQKNILIELKETNKVVPPPVELRLQELSGRLKIQQEQITNLTKPLLKSNIKEGPLE